MEGRTSFFAFSDDKLYYDEARKRFVSTKNAPSYLERQFRSSHFKHQRPDLFGQEKVEFDLKLKLGQQLIRQMNYQTKLEMRRLWRSMNGMSYNYFYPLLDDFSNAQAIDKVRTLRAWTWEDSSRIANLMTCHLMRAQKYGLEIGVQRVHGLTKEELLNRENQLTEFFLHELRKPKAA